MTTLQVQIGGSAARSYDIVLGDRRQLGQLVDFSRYSKIVIVTDETVAALWLPEIQGLVPGECASIVLPAGEIHKNLQVAAQVWTRFADLGLDRAAVVILLGGGVVGDLGGFCASSYMRGVDFIQVPTTLLSQVDASVGGKVAVNHGEIKNLIGAFAQPVAVMIDVDFLRTLDSRIYRSGFGEILKHGLIADESYFRDLPAGLATDPEHPDIARTVRRSCEIKANFVMADEREAGCRKILNFGHTIGHAIESATMQGPETLLHGEAVALGMLAEARLSSAVLNLPERDVEEIRKRLVELQLPISLPRSLDVKTALEFLQHDKKRCGSEIGWTLLDRIGHGIWDCSVPEDQIRPALESLVEERHP